jgi:RimJ/RimL family protein N-acetyltransferase
VEEGDLSLFVRWFNDPDVRYWLSMSDASELTMESEREWYEEMRADPAQVIWCIETEKGQPIGNLGLHSIDEAQGRATLGIAIGEKAFWSRGYGTEAIRQVLRYAFDEMGLRRIALGTDEDNARGIRCYEKCGFVREGLLRAYRLRRGQPVDSVAMSILREEFEAQPPSD